MGDKEQSDLPARARAILDVIRLLDRPGLKRAVVVAEEAAMLRDDERSRPG